MSGLEAIGIAASIIQVAELGTKLAVKLCTFYRQVKESNESIQNLSSDVSLTCSILHQLGDSLNEDAETRLYSAQAFLTAQEVLEECRRVFDKIDHAVEEQRRDNTKNRVARVTRKFGLALMEGDLDAMRTNLERLKSTVLLMLNVIIYAGQIRCKSESPLLKEQRELINLLVAEKKANEEKYTNLKTAIESVQVNNHFQALSSSISQDTASTTSTACDPLPTEIKEYQILFRDLLDRVDACKYTLEPSRHRRIRSGVMDLNLAEEILFQSANRQNLSQLACEDSVSESQAIQSPAASRKKRKARLVPAYFGSDAGLPAACCSPYSSFESDFSGINHPAAAVTVDQKAAAPWLGEFSPMALTSVEQGHASSPEDFKSLPSGPPLDRGSHDSYSRSVVVADAVNDVVLEWTTIESGELLG
ncbi:uncharacterized protein EURHEDRAFT_384996 [Aspergillus ruber CBS 135680]|uniref:Fungal N-terminal domain-containing protein n=1 Tax=Aspergillus ruber (strain CBS 135680) TaxID=1388766 RepID=A0A017SJC5_ASPRC|nr:uncharacterized protein EURHEDRAFT_384996 [Aspergillus ruber CBS 135680]EYE96774.1 hypothetical protein EURHEDRAFT_384996 [Aspergillus ruber CBS 135680]